MAIKKIKLDISATNEEKQFIDVLCCNEERDKENVKLKPITVAEMKARLRGYIHSCNKRVNWGFINKVKCEKYAQSKLNEL